MSTPDLSHSPLSIMTVEDIFAADPADLADPDFDALVKELRRRRDVFAADEAAKASEGKKARAKRDPTITAATAAALDKPVGEVNLDDLL